MKTLTPILLLAASLAPSLNAAALVSGSPVPVGTPEQTGPASIGLNNRPLGTIRTERARPDLVVDTGSHSPNHGLYLLPYLQDAPDGSPVFEQAIRLEAPRKGRNAPPAAIWQSASGTTHGFWLLDDTIQRTVFNKKELRFEASAPDLKIEGLPRAASAFTVLPNADGSLTLYFAVSDGASLHPPEKANWRSEAYRPYDGAFIFRGGIPKFAIYAGTLAEAGAADTVTATLASETEQEALLGVSGLTPVYFEEGGDPALVMGTASGNLLYYAPALPLPQKAYLADDSANPLAVRTPAINPSPVAYPNTDGVYSDLIVGGEGPLSYYSYTGAFTEPANAADAPSAPVYAPVRPVQQAGALLYPGSLPVLSAVDWDGDGVTDIISGNSEGQILFFKNIGTDAAPAFANAVQLEAAGKPIHIQQGYANIQGPFEQRWGYSCPTVFDWNGDGLPDIVTSSATAEHRVYLNSGTKTEPRLDAPLPLYCDGMDVHGTWRTQPAVATIGERTAYIALDDQDELHLYWRIDNQNLRDGGKLHLDDGATIQANFLKSGGTGRLKLQLVDWDMDGKLDLLVGTPRHGSVPNPETGLPQSAGLKGAAVLFLKNVGTNEEPVYQFPVLMRYKGEPIYHHQHACSPLATHLGTPNPDNAPNLFVGAQEGLIYYYDRADLAWD